MSDDKNKPDGEQGKPDGEPGKEVTPSKTYSEEEFKKVVAERQEVKEKLRKIEEEKKADAEKKALEEGKLKELLEAKNAELETERKARQEASSKAEKYEEQQKLLREQALSRIPDEQMRSIAGKLPDLSDVVAFADKYESENRGGPANGKGAKKAAESNPLRRLPGESFTDYQRRVG